MKISLKAGESVRIVNQSGPALLIYLADGYTQVTAASPPISHHQITAEAKRDIESKVELSQ